jgi:hypothetical protein
MELMEQITTLSSNPVPPLQKKPRPVSFHGYLQVAKDQTVQPSSNLMVHKQLISLQDELVKTRRRCAELSEMEARKKGLELRCLGLERVVEDLVSAVEFLKTHSKESIRQDGSDGDGTEAELTGLGVQINATRGEMVISGSSVRASFSRLVVWSRRRIIPYRLRAVILFILSQFRASDLTERLVGWWIIATGAILWTSFVLVNGGRTFVGEKVKRNVGGQTHLSGDASKK